LTTTDGTWTGTSPITFSYQWKRGGVSIGGATSSTYTLVAADSSANITCEVTGTNVAGSVSANSNTITAQNFNPVNTIAPTLSPSGTQSTGTVITLGNGTWSGATPITFEYRWTRDNIVISGQTSNTYTIVAGDDGTVIKGEVRGTNALSTSAYVTSSNQVDAVNVSNTARTQAFLTATGITDATIISALNAMDTSLISAGLLPAGTGAGKIKALYPIVGGTAATHKFNFVNPLDTDAAYRLTFFGGWTHGSTGATPNGTNAYADTFIANNLLGTQDSIHFSYYSRTNNSEDKALMGSNFGGGTNQSNIFARVTDGNNYFRVNTQSTPATNAETSSLGLFIANRVTSLENRNMVRGVLRTQLAISVAPSNLNFQLAATNNALFTTRECAFSTLGEGLSDGELSSLTSLVTTFQTTLGRAV
jgi:hypothetical protein